MERKQKKEKKFASLLLLLFLTIVMLGTATFAWFTSNRTVTVSTLDVHVEAKTGLMISSDGFTWKTIISNSDITTGYSGSVNQVPPTLEPVSTAGKLKSNGQLEVFNGLIEEDILGGTGEFTLAATLASDTSGVVGNYIAFDLFLKTESQTDIYLTTDSGVIAKDTDKGLKNASRVAFIVEGTTASDAPVSTIRALSTTDISKVYIWEPNFDVHTTFGVTAAAQAGITTTTTNATRINYDGVLAANPTPIVLSEANATDNATYFEAVTPKIVTMAAETDYKLMFQLQPGVTKVRVYMWIEGQDVDCENNASGSDISFNLQFSTDSAPTP